MKKNKLRLYHNVIVRSPLFAQNSKQDEAAFAEALYLSTPSLYKEYIKSLQGVTRDPKATKKLDISLYKYRSRASSRCTPFGLFAGLHLCSWDDRSSIVIDSDPRKGLRRSTRLDMNFLALLMKEVESKDCVKHLMKFKPNTSLYLLENHFRYVEYYFNKGSRFHKLSQVDHSTYLEKLLKEAQNGLTRSELSQLLINDDIPEAEAQAFVDEVISSQLLVSPLEPNVIGPEYLDLALSTLAQYYDITKSAELFEILSILRQVKIQLNALDLQVINDVERYQEIRTKLGELVKIVPEEYIFQTDSFKHQVSASISRTIQTQLQDTVEFLHRISPPYPIDPLEDFKKRFDAKYESQEVPLLVALDSESGIGFPYKDITGINQLVDDIQQYRATDPNVHWNPLQTVLLNLLFKAAKEGIKVLQVSEEDFRTVDYSHIKLPPSFTAIFKILNPRTGKIQIASLGGQSANNLIGRFAWADNAIRGIAVDISNFEEAQDPDRIYAEISHLPESRTGNILARPLFRKYEIPYIVNSVVEDQFSIKVADLTLRLQRGKFILYDQRLKKEIIPRLGNAHNYPINSLPVYHFLCELQSQYFGRPYFGFNWGLFSNQFSFLPRVEYKNVIISSATWRLSKEDLDPLREKKKSAQERVEAFFLLKERLGLPDKFLLSKHDNSLLIDTTDPTAIETFLDSVSRSNQILLKEFLFEEDSFITDNKGGSYTNECVAIFLNENEPEISLFPKDTITEASNSTRHFILGDEWVYYKIYCGVKTADRLISNEIDTIVNSLLSLGIIDRWFFIRYADPEFHLRIRFHLKDRSKVSEVVKSVNEQIGPLINAQVVDKLQTDTYVRELERYGRNSIEIAEKMFSSDSDFVKEVLKEIDTSDAHLRWQIAIRSVDAYLDDFGYDQEGKQHFAQSVANNFFIEHGGGKKLKVRFDAKYRVLRKKIDEGLALALPLGSNLSVLDTILRKRSQENASNINDLVLLNKTGNMEVTFDEFAGSLIHMSIDRLFVGKNRTNELALYELLSRYYRSLKARNKAVHQEMEEKVL